MDSDSHADFSTVVAPFKIQDTSMRRGGTLKVRSKSAPSDTTTSASSVTTLLQGAQQPEGKLSLTGEAPLARRRSPKP